MRIPIYKARGLECSSTFSLYAPSSQPPTTATCEVCGCKAKRVFTAPGVAIPWKAHFNHSVGKYVRTKSEFQSELSRGSDEASERTGMDHKFVSVEAGDAPGVTDG